MPLLMRVLLCLLMLSPLAATAYDKDFVEEMLQSQEGIAGLKRREAVIDGHKIAYLDNGRDTAARVVVFVHGFGDSSASWMFFARSFRDGDYRVIVPDLLGFGRSARPPEADYGYPAQANRLFRLLEQLKVTRAHLIGNSMGGGVVAQMALLQPQAVASLTLIDAAGVHYKATELDQQVLKGSNFLIPRKPGDFERLLDFVMQQKPVMTRPIIDYLADRAMKDAPLHDRIFHEVLLRDVGFLTLSLPDIQAPTLVLWGEKDRVLHPDNAKVFQRYIPGSRLHYFPDVGHVPMTEVPDASARVVMQFIEALPSAK